MKNKVPEAYFICADAHNIPLKDKSSDLTISCEVLEHLQNPYLSLKELQRISRNRIFLVVPLEKSLIFKIIWTLWCFIHKHDWGHIWKFDKNDIKRLLEKNNLEIESICTWYQILLAIVAKVKK